MCFSLPKTHCMSGHFGTYAEHILNRKKNRALSCTLGHYFWAPQL